MTGHPSAAGTSPTVHVGTGSVVCATAPTLLLTVLGSCVSVCLWDCVLRHGGMNHFLLPHGRGEAPTPRWGDVAVPRLVDDLRALGSRSADLRAKLFGGAAVLNGVSERESVGEQNVRIALSVLRDLGIPVVARSTGGQQGMSIRFDTWSGGVLARRLASTLSAAA